MVKKRLEDLIRSAVHKALSEFTHDLTTAVGDAYWTYMLQGELEDAFDTALMRAAIDETPVLSGPLPVWAI